jgi:hypothetical protein
MHLTKLGSGTGFVTTRDTLPSYTFTYNLGFIFSFERGDLFTEILKSAQNLGKSVVRDGNFGHLQISWSFDIFSLLIPPT